jgi:Ribonuclease G/E
LPNSACPSRWAASSAPPGLRAPSPRSSATSIISPGCGTKSANARWAAAPALIHSDSDLIKRAIRDIYNRDIEEVVVEGETATAPPRFHEAADAQPRQAGEAYADPVPLFQRYGAKTS